MKQFLHVTLMWILVAFVGDTMVAPLVDLWGIAPDFSIIALVVLGLSAGSLPATAGGFLIGLIQDLGNPALLGLQALCKSCLGFGIGRLRERLVFGLPVVDAVLVALAVLGHDLVFLLVQSLLGDQDFLLRFLTRTLPAALYSALAGVPILQLARLTGVMRRED